MLDGVLDGSRTEGGGQRFAGMEAVCSRRPKKLATPMNEPRFSADKSSCGTIEFGEGLLVPLLADGTDKSDKSAFDSWATAVHHILGSNLSA